MSPKLCDPAQCTGCGACRNACPHDAISLTFDEEGFLSPKIDSKLCVDCKRCENACPILNPPQLARTADPTVYACWSADADVRAQSSSGGMFSVYANHILARQGVVFGVAYDEKNRAVFVKVENVDELKKTRCSKYVQADVGTIYRTTREELEAGRPVLFSGLPCQIAGLYAYLNKEYPNLFTCDLICHGIPSPILFKKWFESLDEQYEQRLEGVDMRAKSQNATEMSIALTLKGDESRTYMPWSQEEADYVGQYFMTNVSLRSSCGQCQFATVPRQGDVTLGDFWSLGLHEPFERRDEIPRGVSVNLINSAQGERLVEQVKDDAVWFERTLQEVKQGNPSLTQPAKLHRKRERFVRDSVALSYSELRRKYFNKLGPTFLERVQAKIVRRFRKIVGKPLRQKIARLFGGGSE